MKPHSFVKCLILPCCMALLTGCQQPAHDMEAMQPPPRPAELDELNEWAGTWHGTGDMTMYGPQGEQKMTSSGRETVKWVCDNRVLMSEMEYQMGDMGTMSGYSMMTYDAKEKKFKSYWFDNFGTVGEGEMWKDATTGMWIMKTEGTDPMTGSATRGKGTIKMPDANTMEWTYAEYDGWGLKKKMEFTGTSKKQ